MSIVKSYSFPEGDIRGDMFYIKHGSNNFTVIDCFLKDGRGENCRKEEIVNEIKRESEGRICRFISTHPDKDHICGLDYLDQEWPILNFYAVENSTPADSEDLSLSKYHQLKKEKNFRIRQGISRYWLNQADDRNGGSGIHFQWPITSNEKFEETLTNVGKGESPNNISCVFTYSLENSATYMWMGDLETDMQQEYYDTCKGNIPKVDILFQPHHGRKSGSIPSDLLDALNPQLIIIGNAPSKHIDYGDARQTITQNSAGDIMFINKLNMVHVYTKNKVTNIPTNLIKIGSVKVFAEWFYCGTLKLNK